MSYPLHAEARATVAASAQTLFDHLDDPCRLGRHMQRSSWRTLGASMTYELDATAGRALGSVIRLHGQVAGIKLELTEVVTEREVPLRKAWETIGEPRLLVIGAYRMGFEIRSASAAISELRLFIDYAPGSLRPSAVACRLAAVYARWCLDRMAHDAVRHFAGSAAAEDAAARHSSR